MGLCSSSTALEDGGGGGGGRVFNTTCSRALCLNKRADLLRRIFSFHKTRNPKEYIHTYIIFAPSQKTFSQSTSTTTTPWTSFPNSNHATTLQSLANRLEELRGDEESSGNVPSVLFIDEGEYSGNDSSNLHFHWYITIYILLCENKSKINYRYQCTLIGKSFTLIEVVQITFSIPQLFFFFFFLLFSMVVVVLVLVVVLTIVFSSSIIDSYNTVNTDKPSGPTNKPGRPYTETPKYKANAVK